ncbi:MAG: lysostaphin resistance A-like protein [Mangrovibacterium sp.]
MKNEYIKPYPTILGAIHLIVLYTFFQTIIDFPFALWDYFHGTTYISNPIKRIVLSVGSILFILIYAYKRSNATFKELFPMKRFNPLVLFPVALILLAQQIYIAPVNIALDKFMAPPSWFLELFDNIFENKYGFWGVLLRVAVIAPIIEESIFRGVIMYGLMRNYPKLPAILLSGLLFGLFHLNPWQFPATFCLGCVLGWLMIITNNLLACILGHAINNLIVLLYIEYNAIIQTWHFFSLSNTMQLCLAVALALFGILLMGAFAYFYRKNTLNYKHFKPNYSKYAFLESNS